MEIYEKIRYYREHTDFSQRNVAKVLGSRPRAILHEFSKKFTV